MDNRQKRTYLVYSRGLRVQDLTFGSLYLDPANPLEGEHRRYEPQLELTDIKEWLGDGQLDEPCNLTFTASRDWTLNAGVTFVSGQAGQSNSGEVTISGTSGCRYQISKPEAFLNDVVLKSDGAWGWLERQLSISRAAYLRRRLRFGTAKQPNIWMVTGIQYITGGDIVNKKTRQTSGALSAHITVPEPTAAVISLSTGESNVNVGGSIKRSSTNIAAYSHSDERIWAAQFTPLNVNFFPSRQVNDVQGLGRVTLRSLQDLGNSGMRGDKRSESEDDGSETALVCGIENDATKKFDDDPESLLKDIEDVDWSLIDMYEERLMM